MTKLCQRFQWGLTVFVLLCAVSINDPSRYVCADDAAVIATNTVAAAPKGAPVPVEESLSQRIRNAIEAVRPSLVTIRPASDPQSVHPVTPWLPEFSDDYSPLNGSNDLPYFLRPTSASSTGGTGVIVSEDGLIWTGCDVIQNRELVIVTLKDGASFPGRVVLNDADMGLAIVKIDATKLPSIRFEPRARPAIADWAVAVAINDLHEPMISAGFISSFHSENSGSHRVAKKLRFSFSAPEDCRGCAFVNLKGEFLGVQVPGLLGAAEAASTSVALDAESAMELQRDGLKGAAIANRELTQPITSNLKTTDVQGSSHSRKEELVFGLNTIREMFLAPRPEWTTEAFASSVRNWLAFWQDAGTPNASPASNVSEPH